MENVENENVIENSKVCNNAIENTVSDTVEQKNLTIADNEKKFCKHCGSEIKFGNNYCSICGISTADKNERHCTNCGSLLEENQKFCDKCGEKVKNNNFTANAVKTIDNISNDDNKKLKIKKIITGTIALIAVVCIAIAFLPKIFVSTDDLLAEAEYEQAYSRASADKKIYVLYENVIANACYEYKQKLKNPDSFKLEYAWVDIQSDQFVLSISGTNGFGGTVKSYAYYTYVDEDKKYELFTSVSDLKEEEIKSYDDSYDIVKKELNNWARDKIKKIITDDSDKLDDSVANRINALNEQGRLGEVKTINEVSNLKHNQNDKSV